MPAPPKRPLIVLLAADLVKVTYTSEQDAAQKIPGGLASFYQQKYAGVSGKRSSDIQAAGQALVAIYSRNIFPDLKVAWRTCPNNLGHAGDPGCFRCHDENRSTADKKTITQDCYTCHQALAVEETSPEILKKLGVADQLTSFEKH